MQFFSSNSNWPITFQQFSFPLFWEKESTVDSLSLSLSVSSLTWAAQLDNACTTPKDCTACRAGLKALVPGQPSEQEAEISRNFFTPLTVGRVSSKPEKPEKKPETENSGTGRARFHFIKFQVSQVRPEETRKFWVGSGFGFFRVFGHSNIHPT